MALFADTDLFVFLATVAQILILGPMQLRRNLRPLPRSFAVESVPDESLTEGQRKYFKDYDEKLARLNYWPVYTYRASGFSPNLLRSYANPMEPVRCVLMIVEVSTNVNGLKSTAHSSTLEFFSYFTDETVLVTRNMKLKSVFEEPPYRITQECPRVTDPAELRRRHMSKLQELNRVAKPAASDPAAINKEFQYGHERFCGYQVQRGNLKPDSSGNWLQMTGKVHWRGIMNFLNPFVQRFAFSRFIPAALLGISIPILASLFGASAVARLAPSFTMRPDALQNLIALASYVLAGAAIGLCLEKNSFLWSFIFTYLAVGVVLGFHPNPLPYGTIGALVAHVVAQRARSSRLILQPNVVRKPAVAGATAGK